MARSVLGTDGPDLATPPIGAVVTGRLDNGLVLSTQCANHLYEIRSDPMAVTYGCGWVVIVRCLVCDRELPPLDADWFNEPTDEDWATCLAEVQSEIDRLTEAAAQMQGLRRGEREMMRDWG